MIPNEEKEGWHYLAVKKLSELLRGITSKHQDDFCSSNCLQSFATKTNLNLKYVKKKKIFCGIVLPTEKIMYQNLINT